MSPAKLLLFKRLAIILIGLLAAVFITVGVFSTIYPDQLGSFVFALGLGGIGATVSLTRRIPKLNESDAESLASSWWILIVLSTTGIVMGGILYIMFLGGILTGDGGDGLFTSNLFPLFSAPNGAAETQNYLSDMRTLLSVRPQEAKDFGMILVWCFLAGYSERFVPSLLHNMEKQAPKQSG